MAQLDREGIFKARPVNWFVRTSENTQTVALVIEYVVVAQLDRDTNEWLDWTHYDEHHVYGNHYVVKRDGTPNVTTVQQLAEAIGWRGSLRQVTDEGPPNVICQVVVKPNVYEGKTSFRVEWVNPEDYVPTGGGAPADEVDRLELRFGSLLRAAAASGSKPKPAAKPAPAPAPKAAPEPAPAPKKSPTEAINPEDIPF